jgi:NADH-quinone oxidoreductase subunit G
LPRELDRRLREAKPLAVVFSPYLTVEEAYLLAKYVREIDPEARLALGPVPVVGEDQHFPGGFTIAAEKCPNRRGVEEVVAHFAGRGITLGELMEQVEQGAVRGLWVSGGYRGGQTFLSVEDRTFLSAGNQASLPAGNNWLDEPTAARLARTELLVVQDLFPSPLSERATYCLPAAAFAERDGSYVNWHDHLQSIRWAIRPPVGVRPEGGLFWELLGGEGLYNAPAVLGELAGEITYFHVARGPIPEAGVNLKVNLLAAAAEQGKPELV